MMMPVGVFSKRSSGQEVRFVIVRIIGEETCSNGTDEGGGLFFADRARASAGMEGYVACS
jgi:hypothetical protein